MSETDLTASEVLTQEQYLCMMRVMAFNRVDGLPDDLGQLRNWFDHYLDHIFSDAESALVGTIYQIAREMYDGELRAMLRRSGL